MQQEQPKYLRIFLCHAHDEDDAKLLEKLRMHLAPLKQMTPIIDWSDQQIEAGTEWAKEIETQLSAADIILLLVSPAFISSDFYLSIQMQQVIKRQQKGDAVVIPIILRPVYWEAIPTLARLQVLPKNGRAITLWNNIDEAFVKVVIEIKDVIQRLLKKKEGNNVLVKKEQSVNSYQQASTPRSPLLTEALVQLDKVTVPMLRAAHRLLGKTDQTFVVTGGDPVPWEDLPEDIRKEIIRRRNLEAEQDWLEEDG